MRYISVFSGIEAASCAWEPLGWEPLCFCEVDGHASSVLRARYPHVPNLGDITKVDWKEFRGRADVVVGGSPCQSFSVAGDRTGLAGASGLMYEYIRCVLEVRPRWFLWENVPGALQSDGGEAFGQLLSSLADGGGYGLAWRVLDARWFGVPQRRRRVFVVGRAGDGYREACSVLFEREGLRGDPAEGGEARQGPAAGAGGGPARTDRRGGAFVQNQRGELRWESGTGDVAGCLSAEPGMKQTTFVCETAHSQSNGLGDSEAGCAGTLDTSASQVVA